MTRKRGQRDLAGQFSVPDSEVSVFEAVCGCWIVSFPAVTPASRGQSEGMVFEAACESFGMDSKALKERL